MIHGQPGYGENHAAIPNHLQVADASNPLSLDSAVVTRYRHVDLRLDDLVSAFVAHSELKRHHAVPAIYDCVSAEHYPRGRPGELGECQPRDNSKSNQPAHRLQ